MSEYARCGDDAPCSVAGDLRDRVRELNATWLRHTWPCGHISEGTGDEPDRCRICVAEERVRMAEAAEGREASLADLLNSWARESGVAPCDRPEDSKGVADRLWAKLSHDLAAARAEIATDDALLAERQRILDALPCREHGPCVPYVLEWIDAVGKLVRAAKRVLSGSDFLEGTKAAMDEMEAAVNDPDLAAWRGK